MKFGFIGTVLFSYEILKDLINNGYKPTVLVTQKSNGINADYVDLEPLSTQHGIFVLKVDEIDSEVIKKLKGLNLDYIFCLGWSKLLNRDILNIPKKGVIGFHPTELPLNRGRHPIIWTLFLGLEKSAGTFFFMDEGADSGDIISQKSIRITYEDDANSLYAKIVETAKEQLRELMPQLESDSLIKRKQSHTLANYWRKRTTEDGKIDFRMCSRAIYNLVRALTKPYVGAHLIYKGKEIKVWKVEEETHDLPVNVEPGKVLDVRGKRILVKTYDGGVWLIEHEFAKMPYVGEYL